MFEEIVRRKPEKKLDHYKLILVLMEIFFLWNSFNFSCLSYYVLELSLGYTYRNRAPDLALQQQPSGMIIENILILKRKQKFHYPLKPFWFFFLAVYLAWDLHYKKGGGLSRRYDQFLLTLWSSIFHACLIMCLSFRWVIHTTASIFILFNVDFYEEI